MAFLAAENENRQQGDLPQDNFGRVPERFLLPVRTKSITKNFVHWKLRPLFVLVMFQRMFSSWALAPTHFTIFIQGMSILLFSFIGRDISLVRCAYSWAIELNTRGEIPYLRAPTYYEMWMKLRMYIFFRRCDSDLPALPLRCSALAWLIQNSRSRCILASVS